MKIQRLLILFFLASMMTLQAQTPAKYWVHFKDKVGTPYTVAHPEAFLSPRAIQQRLHFRIPVTTTDLPINPEYVRRVLAADSTAYLCATSKWLNAITIYSTQDSVASLLRRLPFVAQVECTSRLDTVEAEPILLYEYTSNPALATSSIASGTPASIDYGRSDLQVRMTNAHWLHRMGYMGQGIRMMVMDGGFENVDSIPFFQTLREDHRLLGARNLVRPDEDPFRKHNHGTMVLSCMASFNPGQLVGTAPMAEYYLCQTEDARSETKVEEDYWVAGLEWADSLGCQVLNSSLGYTRFDDTVSQRRTYADLNGIVSRASQAATIASAKGMIICNSAGNEGSGKWKYIGTPADANGILSVGAVMADSTAASFSSFGPTADGRLKPDVCALGLMVSVCNGKGRLSMAAGTSFASPIMAGMVACLWQAFPEKNNVEIMDAVRKSGSSYALDKNPQMGYGIPDFLKAYNILRQQSYSYPDAGVYFSDYRLLKQKNGKWQTMATVYYSAPNSGSLSFEVKSGGKMKVKQVSAEAAGDAHVACYLITLPPLKKGEKYRVEEMNVQCGGKPFSFVFGLE